MCVYVSVRVFVGVRECFVFWTMVTTAPRPSSADERPQAHARRHTAEATTCCRQCASPLAAFEHPC